MADAAPTPAPEKKKKRRWLKVLLIVLAVLLLLPMLVVGGAFIFLSTNAGEKLVRTQALSLVNGLLAGKVDASYVKLEGGHLVLKDVKLFDPEGELVASIAELDAFIDLPSLAGQVVKLTSVTIEKPELFLKNDERGFNLTRAVALKNPGVPDDPTKPSAPNAWRIDIDTLALADGAIDFTLPDRKISTRQLTINGEVDIKLSPFALEGAAKLRSLVTDPLQEKLVIDVDATSVKGPQSFGLLVELGGTRVRGDFELPTTSLTLTELVADPRELKAFVPQWPVLPTISGKGALSLGSADLSLKAGNAKVLVDAKYDLAKYSVEAFSANVSDVDLKELIGADLPSQISLEASGSIADWRPQTITGNVKAVGSWKDGTNELASVDLLATATNGAINIPKGEVTSPGVAINVRGDVTPESLDLKGTLTAKDLRKVDKTLQHFAKVNVGGLAGNGTLELGVKGKLTGPAIKAVGDLRGIQIATVSINQLHVDADIPDVTSPLDTDILLHAKKAKVGEREFEEVTFDFYTHGRAFDLDVSTKGLGDLKLNLIGKLDADYKGASLETALLKATNANWALEKPTRLAWSDGFSIDEFAFIDGEQRLAGQATISPSKLDATVKAARVDLSKLPTIAAPPSLGLAGFVDVDAKATGTLKKPEATARVELHGGKVMEFDGLELLLNGTWKNDRAAGDLKLGTTIGALEGTFDLPVLALINQKPGDATAHFTLDRVAISQLEQKLKFDSPVDGQLGAVIDVTGSAEAPRISIVVSSPELQVKLDDRDRVLSVKSVSLRVETNDKGEFGAKVSASALGGQHHVELDTPMTLASLRRSPPTKDSILAMEVALRIALNNVSLQRVHEEKVYRDDELSGAVSLTGEFKGPVRAPLGTLTLAFNEVTSPPVKNLTGTLALTTEALRTLLRGSASLGGKPMLELDVALQAGISKVIDAAMAPKGADAQLMAMLETTPVKGLLALAPFQLEQALAMRDDMTPPRGVVAATLDVAGTLEALTARLTGSMTNLSFDKVALGSARFDVKATSREQNVTMVLGGQGRDDLKLRGTLGLDVRLSSLKKGLAWKEAPVDASLEARNFDLQFLSGSVDMLRAVAGRLNMKAKVDGKLGNPKFDGEVKLSDGRFALAGFGDYRGVQLDLRATNDLIHLKQLEATSGGGKLSLTARADRQQSGAYRVTSEGNTKKFPIVVDDQLMAIASMKYSMRGDVTSAFADIKELALPNVEVELPDVKRKDLQDLQRPKDVVVLRKGETFTMRRQKELAKANEVKDGPGFGLRAVIVAPRNLWVRSSDVNIEIGLSDGFTVEYQKDLRIRGEARIQRGNLNVIGREFTISKNSEVRFNGGLTDMYINVAAIHVNQREAVKITVNVTGKGTDFNIKPTSDPPMPESDIYAILATGRRTLRQGGGNTITPGQAASVVGQLAASQLKNVIAKKLPLDVLNFETSDEFRNVKLDVGWYLNDSLYLGGTLNVGAKRERGESMWGGRLEYQMTRTISLETYAGDAPSYGADAVFQRDF
ncbi:MAG: translocation/assembly module TamB domain-containing protein [Archangium sp.]